MSARIPPPPLTAEARAAAAARGIAARQLRAAVRTGLAAGTTRLADVLADARRDDVRGRALARMKVVDLVSSFPRIGPVRAAALMQRLGIAANRRVGGLGHHQAEALLDALGEERPAGRLVVLTGPSGVGKGTVVTQVRRMRPDVWVSVSATTREPRAGEVDGVDYLFWSHDRFARTIEEGGFLEWAEFAGNRYGTPREAVARRLHDGQPVLLEIELQGARQVRAATPRAFMVFLVPPSWEALEARLRGRGTEDEAAIERRLERARAELAAAGEFDAIIVNDDVVRAASELVDFL
ncbi:MAG TPA: guanylate kinase [Candidatus Nanopelagicales bacterium]